MARDRHNYGQFCPVAMAAEVFAERWTPLVLRELLCGSRRFNDLRRGVPRMSQSLLSRRLKELEDAGIVRRVPSGQGRAWEYELTPAGEELRPVVMQLGEWGYRWLQTDLPPDNLDVALLMWDLQRRLVTERLPPGPLNLHFHYPDAEPAYRRVWLLWERGEVDVCIQDPGRPVDLTVHTDVRTMTLIWLGDLPIGEALARRHLTLEGSPKLQRDFPSWLGLSAFAGGDRQASGVPVS